MYINGWTREKVMKQIRLKNKGYRSYGNGECRYRTADNNQCLVGCFIPDEKYDREMEGDGSCYVIAKYNLEEYMPLRQGLMSRLQAFHDGFLQETVRGEDFYKSIEEKLIYMEENY